MNTLQALIWDVDGTLAETERDGHRVAFNEAFEQFGLAWRWSEQRYGELLRIAGGQERLLHDLAGQPQAPSDDAARAELASQLHRLKNAIYAEIVAAGRIALRPGVVELMDDCRAAGLPMAIATTTSRGNVAALLTAQIGACWESRFACVVCAEDAPLKKPNPQVYTVALQRLGLPGSAALAIEDSSPGLGACVAAGVPVVLTRSVYFADIPDEGALASGPGLHSCSGWTLRGGAPVVTPGRAGDSRVDFELLSRWHAAQSHQPAPLSVPARPSPPG
ncbi:MAG: HAD-IA family hydrolase [Ideonella sp.]